MAYRALLLGMVLGFSVAVMPSCGPTVAPKKCNSTSCADGCCDTAGECYTGTSVQACGTGAATCQECTGGQTCSQGQCRNPTDGGGGGAGGGAGGGGGGTGSCNSGNCNGCCKTDGTCQVVVSAQLCGKNGGACNACAFGQMCAAGSCTPPCSSCRDGQGNCIDGGNTNNVCGSNGALCLRCDTTSGQSCNGGVCTGGACNGVNCSDGCCAAGACVRDGGNAQCGVGGGQCNTCTGGAQCSAGNCAGGGGGDGGLFNLDGGLGGCDLVSCPTGCCALGLLCLPGDTDFACGTGAAACDTCILSFKTCNAGTKTCQ